MQPSYTEFLTLPSETQQQATQFYFSMSNGIFYPRVNYQTSKRFAQSVNEYVK